MGNLIKDKGHELLEFDYSNVVADADGNVSLSSTNQAPDPLFTGVADDGTLKYGDLQAPPSPDGWGVYAKDLQTVTIFSEQNGAPLELGNQPYYDIDHPLISGAGLPEDRNTLDIATPDTPRVVIFPMGDRGYQDGWFTCGFAWQVNHPDRITSPDTAVLGAPSTRSDPFQLGPTLGRAFILPPAPGGADHIVIYLSRKAATSTAALSAPLIEQFRIQTDTGENVVEFRGPYQENGSTAYTTNKTPLSFWDKNSGVNIHTPNTSFANKEFYVELSYALVDSTGTSVRRGDVVRHNPHNSGHMYEYKPDVSTIDNVVRQSIQGWRPFIRYRLPGKDWGHWYTIRREGGDNLYNLDVWVPVYGPEWRQDSGTRWDRTTQNPPQRDTTGIPNGTEPMTIVEDPLLLTNSGLTPGDHYIKASLYYGDEESVSSPQQKISISTSDQAPRVYEPFFENRLDNPNMIDVDPGNGLPRGWQFGRAAQTVFSKGKVTVDETDNTQTTRGDIISTPHGFIKADQLQHGGRIIVQVADHANGRCVDVMDEYDITGYDANNKPIVSFIRSTTLGNYRRNGVYRVGFKTRRSTNKRDSINLHTDTDVVIIRTVGVGNDPDLGTRNFKVIRKAHGLFRNTKPVNRGVKRLAHKLNWLEPDEDAYPTGGYCHVIASGEDSLAVGVKMNQVNTGIDIPSHADVNTNASTQKTISVKFKTNDVSLATRQLLYKQGNGTAGYAIYITTTGQLAFVVLSGGVVKTYSTAIKSHTKYMASLVHNIDGTVKFYLDGVLKNTSTAFGTSVAGGGTVSAGYNKDSYADTTGASIGTSDRFAGRLYEVRVWKDARTATEISTYYDTSLTTTEQSDTDLVLLLKLKTMEGSTAYDSAQYGLHSTLLGNFRWISDVPDAGYSDGSVVIDAVHFNNNSVPSPWTVNGAATHAVGDYSVSRFSDYGVQVTGTSTNLKYISRSISGAPSNIAIGARKKFVTIPTIAEHTLLQITDGTGAVIEAKLVPGTNGSKLQARAVGGTWTTFERGIEAGERLYFEITAEGLGTASGVLRAFVGQNHEEEMTETLTLTGINFTGRSAVTANAGVVATSAGAGNTWEYHMGVVFLTQNGKRAKNYLPGNFIEYFGPDGTPQTEYYGPTGFRKPVTPGTQLTHSVYAECEDVDPNTTLFGTSFFDANNRLVDTLDPLVTFLDTQQEWTRFTQTFTVPSDAAYMEYTRNNLGGGVVRVQAPQIEAGSTATAFTALRNTSGYVRVRVDSVTQGLEPGKPMDILGAVKNLCALTYDGATEDNTSITLEIASAPTLTGTYTSYYTDLSVVPKNRFYEIKATLATTDAGITPLLSRIALRVARPYPVLTDGDGREFTGGALVNNLPAPITRRLIEITQMENGSNGFTTWGSTLPYRWLTSFEVKLFRPSQADIVTDAVGKGNSEFQVEHEGTLYQIRVLDPIEMETRRVNKIELVDEEEDFVQIIATMPDSFIVDQHPMIPEV